MSDDQRVPTKGHARSKEASQDSVSEASSRQENRLIQTPTKTAGQKTAIVHDWLNGMRGGEIVFEGLLDLFPHADVFTLFYEPEKLHPRLRAKLSERRVFTSGLNRFAWTRRAYRHLLPILPFAIRQLDLYPYSLVISSSHCVAKGVRKHPTAFHASYIHAPMRYMWGRFQDYFGPGKTNLIFRAVALLVRPFLQAWDRSTSSPDRVDQLFANSRFIAEEIRRFYRREAQVIYPFARLDRFHHPRKAGGYYLMVGAFAPYKRTDLAIEVFARLGLPLKIVGEGQEHAKLLGLRDRLGAKNIEFLGNPSNDQIEQLYAGCRAFIFPGEEDFGITPLEAMASGAPVIAYRSGGACETVTERTGILFKSQTVDALSEAVMDIESGRRRFDPIECREQASAFNEQRFQKEFLSALQIPR